MIQDPKRLTKPEINRSDSIFQKMTVAPQQVGGIVKTGNLDGEWLSVTIPQDYTWGDDIEIAHHLNRIPLTMIVEGGYPLIKGTKTWTRNLVYVMCRTIFNSANSTIRFMIL